ncbi:hypothetical protein F5887DRAFT_1077225 [Amanita rubescens]|nr:hypothetical protein F5887DRAFT_1077225 [Amanita rubescens]
MLHVGLKVSLHGLVSYEYDPTNDQIDPPDNEDLLHDPRSDVYLKADPNGMPWRGKVYLLILIILGLTLFIFYPVYTWYTQLPKPITTMTRQPLSIFVFSLDSLIISRIQLPNLVDTATPNSSKA